MTLKMTSRQAELMRELLLERTQGFDWEQFEGEDQLVLLREYEELFSLFGGAEELAQRKNDQFWR